MDRIDDIVAEFGLVPPEDRLYLLLDYAERLPPLPERLEAARDAGLGRVHECASPVFLYPEVEGGAVRLYADVPREAPTARGLVGLLVEALDRATPAEVAAVPDDLLHRLGLAQQLGMRRQQGLTGVLHRLKAGVAEAAAEGKGEWEKG
jgi:cysteine desulfuration protein SufE